MKAGELIIISVSPNMRCKGSHRAGIACFQFGKRLKITLRRGVLRFTIRFRTGSSPRPFTSRGQKLHQNCMKPNDGGQNHILADAITSGFPPSGRRDFSVSRGRAVEAHPSPAEAAVEVALLNNKGLQAAFNELGIAEAVMIEASLSAKPDVLLLAVAMPMHMIAPVSAGTEIGGAAGEQYPDNASQRCWQRYDDHERIDPCRRRSWPSMFFVIT